MKDKIITHYNHRKKQVYGKNSKGLTELWDEKENIRNTIYDELISNASVVAEIGVRLGENACMISLRNPSKLYLVDPWIEKGGYPHHSKNNEFFKIVTDVFADEENTQILRQKSQDAVLLFEDDYFDVIYVDSGHTYDDVLRDLTLWSKKVKVGGFIVGDDYFGKENPDDRVKWKQHSYGVIEAVADFIRDNKYKIYYSQKFKEFPLPAGQFILQRVQ
jgi:cephalosporin hydroxylase